MKLSLEELEALVDAVEVVAGLVESGAEDPEFLAMAGRSARAGSKVRNEIKRRLSAAEVRRAVKLARAMLSDKDQLQP